MKTIGWNINNYTDLYCQTKNKDQGYIILRIICLLMSKGHNIREWIDLQSCIRTEVYSSIIGV